MMRPAREVRSARGLVLALAPAISLCGCAGTDEGETASASGGGRGPGDAAPAGARTDGAIEAASPAPRDSALIAYIANEGVMLVAGGKTVLIDALYREGVNGYETVNSSMREAMEESVGAFAGVQLVLASHHHPDHFDATAVFRHLNNNPVARFVSTRQAAGLLDAASARGTEAPPTAPGGAGVETAMERVVGVWPEAGRDTVLFFEDIELRVLNLHHGRDFDPPVQNLGLLVDSGGFRALHVGDTEASVEDLAVYALAEEGIHVALLPYWKLLEEDRDRLLREIGAQRVVAMHVPVADAPASWFGRAGNREALVQQLESDVPGVIVLDEPGETHKIGYWRGAPPGDAGP